MKAALKGLVKWVLLFGLLAAFVIGGEIRHNARVRPDGVHSVAEHLQRFGPPARIFRIQRADGVFFYFAGHMDSDAPWLKLPSGPPAYIYDSRGRLVDWCGDSGDADQWVSRWLHAGTKTDVSVEEVRREISE
ncbi:MAG TPA: hypothetical protein VGO11_25665 [Chthoniobacteraceae bacterium]|jgi:hypothetical protein|nr:hypothetical protein [Chthoniobacteraceae bacterium]